jgi:virulence factor Mce-like protein
LRVGKTVEYKSSEIKAGMFIFLGFVALVVTVFMLGDIKNLFKSRKEMKIYFSFADGLEEGAPVRYAGLEIGRVKKIHLDGVHEETGKDRVAIVAEISPSIQIKKDSSAVIKTSGLMGGLYVDIRPGTRDSPPLAPGEPLTGQESFELAKVGDMMDQVVTEVRRFADVAEGLAADSRATLQDMRATLASVNQAVDGVRGPLADSLQNLKKVSAEISRLLTDNRSDFRQAMTHFAAAAEKGDRLLTDKTGDIVAIIDQANRLSRELEILLAETRPNIANLIRHLEAGSQKIAARVDTVSQNLDDTLHQGSSIMVDNRRNLTSMIKNLRDTSANLKTISDDIKRNPWKLVRKTDEIPPSADETVKPAAPQKELRIKRLDKIAER